MTKLIYGEQAPGDAEHIYVRMETEQTTMWGTVPRDCLEPAAVKTAEEPAGVFHLDSVEGYYSERITEAFDERPLERFVEKFATRTPYSLDQAAVIVTRGWFDMSETAARQAINQHLRETYNEMSEAELAAHVRSARRLREQIKNTATYPYGL